MSVEIDYQGIVTTLWTKYGDKLSEWETEFIDNVMDWKGEYTDKQKEIIRRLNTKYRKNNK